MTNRPTFDDLLEDWLQGGPADAPKPLLDGILDAVPTIPQRRGGWPAWAGGPMFLLARAAAGIAVVVVIGVVALFTVLRPAPGTGIVGGAPSPSPTTGASATTGPTPTEVAASPSPAPSDAPTTAAVAACNPGSLAARVTAWEGAAGSRIATVVLSNTGSVACSTRFLSRPQLIDANGTVLINGAMPASSAELTIPAGASATTLVRSANYCGPTPALPVTVGFILPGGGRVVATAAPGADVPPCNGATVPAEIEMQPWAR